jgi:hypothetical protein
MSFAAPLRVPVEIRGGARWFRLAHAVSDGGLELGQAAPEELSGAVELTFHLPGDRRPIHCHGRVGEAELRFLDLDEDGRARIVAYIQERLGIPE